MPSRVEEATPQTRNSLPTGFALPQSKASTTPATAAFPFDQLINSARIQALSPFTRPLHRRRGTTSTALPPTAKIATNSEEENNRPRSSPSISQDIPPPLSGSAGASYFSIQPAASGTEARSPANRRPPASRSSHGIETSSGPPPALSTQRTHSFENPWKNTAPQDLPPSHSQLTPRALASLDTEKVSQKTGADLTIHTPQDEVWKFPKRSSSLKGEKTSRITIGAGDAMIATITQTPYNHNFDKKDEPTLRSVGSEKTISLGSSKQSIEDMPSKNKQDSRPSESSQEDLFLNLALSEDAGNEAPVAAGWRQRRQVSLTFTLIANGYLILPRIKGLSVHYIDANHAIYFIFP